MKDKIEKWLYKFYHGHPFLLSEEVDIICETRFNERFKWMNDCQIQRLVKMNVKEMYRQKYPNAKRFQFFTF